MRGKGKSTSQRTTTPRERVVLMSLKSRYAQDILSGEKTIELRKKLSGCAPGTQVVIYNSYPVKEVQGSFEVGHIYALPLDDLWQAVSDSCGVSRAEFDNYFEGKKMGYGIEVTNVRSVKEPFELGFKGPQSFCYLNPSNKEQQDILNKVFK